MRTPAVAVLALVALGAGAQAADLPIKAPPYNAPAAVAAPSNSGFYVGINFLGAATQEQLSTAGGIFSSVLGGAASVGGNIGYQYWAPGGMFLALEVDADYDLRGSTSIGLASTSTTWRFMELVKLGMGLGGLLGVPANATASGSQAPQPIAIPSGFSSANAAPYLQAGAVEKTNKACLAGGCANGQANGWAVGAGVDLVVAQHLNIDLSYLYVDYTGGNSVGGPVLTLNTPNEQLGKVSLNYKF